MAHLCAIHQPNFFPWLGYFDKISRADVFVFLDGVDYPRHGSHGMGSIVNRVKVDVQGKEGFVSAPLRRAPLGTPVGAIMIDDSQSWRKKILRTLTTNYARASNFRPAMTILEPLICYPQSNLAAFNVHTIKAIAAILGLETKFLHQSELSVAGKATELLIGLVKAAGCDGYIAGGGAGGYQQDEQFDEAGITLVYQNFKPAPYGPPERFKAGLSVIDYLMHDGRLLADVPSTNGPG